MTENETQNQHPDGSVDMQAVEAPIQIHEDRPLTSVEQFETGGNIDVAAKSSEGPASLSRLTPGAIFFGALVSLGLIGFVLFARVTVHPFDQVNRKMRVIDVWDRLRNNLPDVAHPTILGIVYDISIALVVIGSLACIWLALMATSDASTSAVPPADLDETTVNEAPAMLPEH
jgi:hypothetical protein